MVKKQFEYLDIQCWEHTADRRFGVKPPFICLKAGPEACDRLLMLLDVLADLQPPAQRAITLKQSKRPKACSKIRFIISPVSNELAEMSLAIESQAAEFEFTLAGLNRFREAVESWKNGRDDFSVRPSKRSEGTKDKQSGEIWFWTLFTEP